MPWFRRPAKPPPPLCEFTVGVNDHRVTVGGPEQGITILADLRNYVAAVTGGAAHPTSEGRDPVAVLSAKMDYAELVNDTAMLVTLAFEELVEREIVAPDEVPAQPALPPLPQRVDHYAYIQASYARAARRLTWLETTDQVFRRHDVALLPPVPKEDPLLRPR